MKIQYPIENPYALSEKEIFEKLFADAKNGLTKEEAENRIKQFGKNIIQEKRAKNPILIFFSQFKGPFVILLLVAAGLSFYFKEWIDGNAILVVLVINAIIGFIMEYQAERSMEALKQLTKVHAKVVRGEKLKEIPSEEIVPGDILFVEAGDLISVDARLFNISQFQTDESALTGESVPVEKEINVLKKNTALTERINMIYKGTFATKGNAKAIVTGTGMQTEFGNIATLVQTAEQSITPLEKKLMKFSKKLIVITVALVIIIFIAGILNGQKMVEMLKTAIALAVAAIPEGLPIVATLALAKGMLQMAKHKVIVKKLSAVETLGGTNVICTDKTGTLTQNKIQVSIVQTPDETVEVKDGFRNRKSSSEKESFGIIKKISVLCNTAELIIKKEKIKEVGDPLETGLLKFAFSEGTDIEQFRKKHLKIDEKPFSSETKIMATLHKKGNEYFVSAKGAVEELLKKCTKIFENNEVKNFTEKEGKKQLAESEDLAKSGLRVIAMAFKNSEKKTNNLTDELVFAGLVGMLDPPRKEVYSAIEECKSAGIKVKMITGDHPSTAKNIALKLGLIDSEKEIVIHGKEMSSYKKLSAEEKKKWVQSKIFARVSPEQKLDLIKVLQEKKYVVGMTGDGVNDAPALKKADIGIAMGQRGTQVAQEVADMILKDDSFSSIVSAIRQGRIIFDNIRKFVVYLLSCNMSELFVVSVVSVLNLHFQLFPLQILFINLVTDVFPALALGFTEGNSHLMKQPPRKESEPIIDKKRWISLLVFSIVITGSTIGAVFFSHFFFPADKQESFNNILFYTLIFSQLFHVLNMSTEKKIFWETDVFRNKYVWYSIAICVCISVLVYFILPIRNVLSIREMTQGDWIISVSFGFLSLLIIQSLKRMKFLQ